MTLRFLYFLFIHLLFITIFLKIHTLKDYLHIQDDIDRLVKWGKNIVYSFKANTFNITCNINLISVINIAYYL